MTFAKRHPFRECRNYNSRIVHYLLALQLQPRVDAQHTTALIGSMPLARRRSPPIKAAQFFPSLTAQKIPFGIRAEQLKNQPTPSTPSTRAERLLLTADGCA